MIAPYLNDMRVLVTFFDVCAMACAANPILHASRIQCMVVTTIVAQCNTKRRAPTSLSRTKICVSTCKFVWPLTIACIIHWNWNNTNQKKDWHDSCPHVVSSQAHKSNNAHALTTPVLQCNQMRRNHCFYIAISFMVLLAVSSKGFVYLLSNQMWNTSHA